MSSCCRTGPGYASPMDAVNGPREKILYVTCIQPNGRQDKKSDYLAVVDVDPTSSTYSQVISRCHVTGFGDEIHHMGWNTCSSCHGKPDAVRNRLILPSLLSANIYIMDTSDEKNPKLIQTIDGDEVKSKCNVAYLHTAHCLPSRHSMISTLGDAEGNARGAFLLLKTDSEGKFEIDGIWDKQSGDFGYDFWYQPRFDVMISSGLAEPNAVKDGFKPEDVGKGLFGQKLHVFRWSTGDLIQKIDLGSEGMVPGEIRFLHDPAKSEGYVTCILSSSIFHFFQTPDGQWDAKKVIQTDSIEVSDWLLPSLPAGNNVCQCKD